MTTTPLLSPTEPPRPQLHGTLRPRHLTMLAMGGVIGSGLFVGSGAGIAMAGPGIVLSFVAAGVLTMLVMRMMAEMAAAFPASGSFSEHAERAFGPWAGFTIGWLYWVTIVVVLAVESTAAAVIVHGWLPAVPQWLLMLVFMTVFTAVNLSAVGNFGEFEFWFALIKVAAIVGFLVLGVLAILGVLPGRNPGALGGDLLPQGWGGVVAGFVAAVPAFGGLEVVTIAAAESDDPVQAAGRAVRSAVWRISVFYIGSMIVLVSLLPWNDSRLGTSPFVAVLDEIGVPGAAQIMNVVVVLALLSALNAGTYAAARMAFSLARRGQAPAALTRISRSGVPYLAVLASTAFGFGGVVLNLLWPETIFLHLLNAVGTVMLLVWLLVACSQLRLRGRLPEGTPVRMWGHPYLGWLTLAVIVALLGHMFFDHDTRIQLVSSAVLALVVLSAALIRHRRA
ncbi:aromatic amino acid permease [Kitasatospora gansuensis]|uniref:Aromatic amino acid permease n=1 Tax=Kitasatospora gansuensis TaxID=258050 RepID=A0A7W7SJR5_9ACTN|nr:amino acid permease [Kitasatospora gansuensis]MBB4950591.1 aromatic amino acid permease [Kitasatospora gansuensis]